VSAELGQVHFAKEKLFALPSKTILACARQQNILQISLTRKLLSLLIESVILKWM
jgi:hypothetical protein